jgi:glycosyltransferase involved in cell wall biosynthesis
VIPAIFFRLLYKTPIIIQYEDGLFDAPNKFTSIVSTILESIFKRLLNGAILNNLNFKNRILTDNYCVIRGFIDDNIDVNLNLDTNHKDKKIVLFSGQIDKIRGIDIFLDICEKASKDEELKDKLEFWITGHGKEKLVNKVKERVSQMSNVKYLGFLPYNKYKETLEKADILVNLQKPYVKFSTYCFPSKIIEFMNTGKIIISTKISDIENIATDKIILIECNPNDVINVLRQILKNYKMFANYGNNAKKWVFNNCTYTNAGEHLKVIIERAIKLH